jgi:uncharacterized membrane protein YoaK (UPF0700 family)
MESILQNADVLLIGSTMIPLAVQFIKSKLPKLKPQFISFVVSFIFALLVLLFSAGMQVESFTELASQSLTLGVIAWRWADGTYRTVKPVASK